MARYTPTVNVAGVPIASSWAGDNVAALSQIRINWGREDIYSEPDPSTLEFDVIDPAGTWSGDPTLYDKRVTIAIPALSNRVIYRGDVTGVKSRRIAVTNDRGERVRVWLTTITAAAPDAALRRMPAPGWPSSDAFTNRYHREWYGAGYWWYDATNEVNSGIRRVNVLLNAGANAHVDSIEVPTDARWRYLVQGLNDESAHEIIALGYRGGIAGGHVNYDPATNGIVAGRPATAGSLALAYTNNLIRLVATGAILLPAGSISVPTEGAGVSSTVGDAIDTVSVEAFDASLAKWDDPNTASTSQWNLAKVEANTSSYERRVPGTANKSRKLSVVTAHRYNLTQTGLAALDTGVQPLQSLLVTLVQFLNGKTVPTGLSYDWERNAALTPAQDAHLFNTLDVATPVMFPGSDLTGFPNLGPFFQIIGGTLTYSEGWRHDITLAPAPGTVSTLTVDQLVTNPTPTISQYSPEISIYDLGSVQSGAA